MSGLSLPSLVREKPTLKHVRASYEFQGRSAEELSFKSGDAIEVTSMSDKNWWEGRCAGVSGTFPSNYVEEVPDDQLAQKNEQKSRVNNTSTQSVTALHNFKARTPDELSFKKGDVIAVVRDIDQNFWEGKLNNKTGCVPKTYVSEPVSQASPTNRAGKPKGNAKVQLEAVYDFGGRSADELSFKQGEIIVLVEKVDAAWWKGKIGRKEGVFPANYVKVLEDKPKNAAKQAAQSQGQPSGLPKVSNQKNSKQAAPRGALEPRGQVSAVAAGPVMVKAQFNYTRQNRDELSMRKDQIMTLITKQDADWWQVSNEEGRTGLVPAAFMIEVAQPRQPRGGAKGMPGVAAGGGRRVVEPIDKEKEKERAKKKRQKEKRKMHRAATKLQARYRGYHVRVRRHRHGQQGGGIAEDDDNYQDDGFEEEGDGDGDDVQGLVGHRLKQGVLQMKVRWNGSGPEEDEWFPADALEEEWPHLVEKYKRDNATAIKRIMGRSAGGKVGEPRQADRTGGMNKMGPSRINV